MLLLLVALFSADAPAPDCSWLQAFHQGAMACARAWGDDERLACFEKLVTGTSAPPTMSASDRLERAKKLLRAKEWDVAIDDLKVVLELEPKRVDAWLLLGQVYADSGDDEQAAGAFEEFLTLAPAHPEAPRLRALVDTLRGRSAWVQHESTDEITGHVFHFVRLTSKEGDEVLSIICKAKSDPTVLVSWGSVVGFGSVAVDMRLGDKALPAAQWALSGDGRTMQSKQGSESRKLIDRFAAAGEAIIRVRSASDSSMAHFDLSGAKGAIAALRAKCAGK